MSDDLYMIGIGNPAKYHCVLEIEKELAATRLGVDQDDFWRVTDFSDYMKCLDYYRSNWYTHDRYLTPRTCESRQPVIRWIRSQMQMLNRGDILTSRPFDLIINKDGSFHAPGNIYGLASELLKTRNSVRVALKVNVRLRDTWHFYCIITTINKSEITSIDLCDTGQSPIGTGSVLKMVESTVGYKAGAGVKVNDLMWTVYMNKDPGAECINLQEYEYPTSHGFCGAWGLYVIDRCFLEGETPEQVYEYFRLMCETHYNQGLTALIMRWWDGHKKSHFQA